MKKIITPLLTVIFLFAGCSLLNTENGKTTIKKELPRELTAGEKQLINAGNAFSYEIFRKITASEEHENVIISPLSISIALGMALNGSAAETRTAMKDALGVSALELKQINQSYQSLIELLVNLDPKVQMNIANSVWSDKGFSILPSFTERVKKYFDARAQSLDFADPASVDVINNWVEEKTEGMIDEIIKQIPPLTVAYLINAVYFKGDWLYQFDPEKTKQERFTLADGSAVKTAIMNQEQDIDYFRSDEVVIAELPYGNSLYRMTLLMPSSREVSLNQFIQQSLSDSTMQKWLSNLKKTDGVIVKLPKFSLKYKKGLKEVLTDMGMGIAFNKYKANFSNFSKRPTFISSVKHKAAITVNEQGTEAAAVTSVEMTLTSIGPHIFLNRPFVFLIRENVSGAILFMGQVYNPKK